MSVPAGDAETQEWLDALTGTGARRDEAVSRLHGLLLRAARFEVNRRKRVLPHLRGAELDDIAVQSADDALVSILARLSDFRGESRFTTWAYKFAIFEAAVALRRRAWQGREIPIEPERWPLVPSGGPSPEAGTEQRELLAAISDGVREALTPHQRRVLVSVVLDDVPIDVLAERLGTTRGALYKTLHDARARLRADLEERGLAREHEGSKP
ncbi:MAG TPA: sigma-70 family RNA polymerase sigma factor [Gaiellaceae bacterium]|nr:sigma-70 family RNA polymerase sigma factor [Gaiellaceae bacterium]